MFSKNSMNLLFNSSCFTKNFLVKTVNCTNITTSKYLQCNYSTKSVPEFRPLYLDAQATTQVDPRVLDKMLPYYIDLYGNAHSKTHAYGWESMDAIEEARENAAKLIGAEPKEIIFTSGATESNNLSVKGIANFYKNNGNHIITTETEHKCVLESCRYLENNGFKVTYLPVGTNGIIDLERLKKEITPETILVSVMTVNNEIGVIQPIKEIGEILKEHKNIHFHTDAAQAAGKIKIDVNELNVDLMSISGHKLYGPKGVGIVYVRRRPRVRVEALISGGGQERGLRSGTLPTPIIVGFGEACRIAKEELSRDESWVNYLSNKLWNALNERLEEIQLNGDINKRYPGNLNVSFTGVEGESLLMGIKDVACSSGSACTSASLEPSYVLRSLGVSDELAHSSLRFGIGRFTTEAEIDQTIESVITKVEKLREMSPLWDMFKDGIDLSKIEWQH